MPGEFIPFSTRSKLTGASGATAQFAAAARASSTGEPAKSLSAYSASMPHPHEINVEVKRDGDRISQIRIQCRCGELIELDCEY